MIINKAKLREAGYRIEEKNGEIAIFPLNGNNDIFNTFRDVMSDYNISVKDVERLADKFAGEVGNTLIFNLFD